MRWRATNRDRRARFQNRPVSKRFAGTLASGQHETGYVIGYMDRATEDAAAKAEALSQVPRWIPCEERMPKKSGEYAVCIKCHVTFLFWNHASWSSDADCDIQGATHWMPLPEPPK